MSTTTIPVKKFVLDNFACFRFPYRTARVRSEMDGRLPRSAVTKGIFDDNHQCVLVTTHHDDFCALYNSDGWVRPNARHIVLTPGQGNPTTRDYTCLEVYRSLEETGEFVVGNYTYKVQP